MVGVPKVGQHEQDPNEVAVAVAVGVVTVHI